MAGFHLPITGWLWVLTDSSKGHYVPRVVEGIRKYKGHRTSWFKRKHGLYNERRALGSRFLPITPWLSEMIWRLLAWPGTESPNSLVDWPTELSASGLSEIISTRLHELADLYCSSLGMPSYKFPVRESTNAVKQGILKVAVVQSVMPILSDFAKFGVGLADPAYRRRHRRHLTAMLRAVLKLLEIREGYKQAREHVDLIVFPELAIHEDDIYILIRFADTVKCMVFGGLVFHSHPHVPNTLVNSGVWLLPVRRPEGRTIFIIEQGKQNLTRQEQELGISSYRPCQWIIEGQRGDEPSWRLTAAICYDATDLCLAAEMRNRSDGFIVSALNQDTVTFDTMVAALHYHMYQHVILVNSGEFGGTTAQTPFKAPYKKVIVHHHGSDAPLVSVFDVDLLYFRRLAEAKGSEIQDADENQRKYPPAGFRR